jgi:hypothetical protein
MHGHQQESVGGEKPGTAPPHILKQLNFKKERNIKSKK